MLVNLRVKCAVDMEWAGLVTECSLRITGVLPGSRLGRGTCSRCNTGKCRLFVGWDYRDTVAAEQSY